MLLATPFLLKTPGSSISHEIMASHDLPHLAAMNHTASQPLPDVGSFSSSWPTNKPKAQVESIHDGDIAAFIETDPELQCSFDFRPPRSVSELGVAMTDADQMFCNGLLLPLLLVSQEGEENDDGHTLKDPVLLRSLSLDSSQRIISASKRHRLARPASLNSSPSVLRGSKVAPAWSSRVPKGAVFRASKLRLPSFGRCGKLPLPRGLSCKNLRHLVPLYHKIVRCVWRRKEKDAPQRAAAELSNGKVSDLGREGVPSGTQFSTAKNPSRSQPSRHLQGMLSSGPGIVWGTYASMPAPGVHRRRPHAR